MADWYDEDMPGQEDPCSRDHRIMMENYFEGLQINTENNTDMLDITKHSDYVGKKYRHRNGATYTLLFLTNTHTDPERLKDHPIDVIYMGENGKLWSRKLSDWDRSFTLISE